jgi:hypothetical protein
MNERSSALLIFAFCLLISSKYPEHARQHGRIEDKS